ncbi:MAG TPA: hypothetical protein PK517_01630 [Nitrosomonas sp.]|nr:hypothetical protein [Nitrosomonas sp.]
MNTHGHHRVADEAGLQRLRDAFADIGVQDLNLTSFYFGNWLTDLSQVRDPDIATTLSAKARDFSEQLPKDIGPILAGLQAFIEQNIDLSSAPPDANKQQNGASEWVKQAKAALHETADQAVRNWIEAIQLLLKSLAELGPARMDDFMTAAVKFKAYAKFAHPDPNEKKPGLNFQVFTKIFERNFTYYFPHEHLDRPHCRFSLDQNCCKNWGRYIPTNPERLYASKLANGEYAIGSDNNSVYDYLEEDRRVVSAALAIIDKEWASKYFTEDANYGTDLQFHLGLADFGHALHAIEDFFAHSNFIEHAAVSCGEVYLKKHLYKQDQPGELPSQRQQHQVLEQSKGDFRATKVFRRLKRFTPDVDAFENEHGWAFVPEEHSIVTGYFDRSDTVISLLHALEEVFDFSEPEKVTDPFTNYLKEYGEDRTDELIDPIKKIIETFKQQTPEGKLRKELRVLLDFYTGNKKLEKLSHAEAEQEILACIKDKGLFQRVPDEIKDVVVNLVYFLVDSTLVSIQRRRASWNFYQLIKNVIVILENPLAFLSEPITSKRFNIKFLASWTYKIFFETQFETLRFNFRNKLHAMLGGYRIGSHSLLAKDYQDEALFEQAFNCARALHWYIVDTMCRWTDQEWIKQANDDAKWVDWDELLAHFLRHPRMYLTEEISKSEIMPIVGYEKYEVKSEDETFRTIAATKLLRSQVEGNLKYGSYEDFLIANLYDNRRLFRVDVIAGMVVDENFVAEIVSTTGMGSRNVTRGSYSLKPGLNLWYPYTVDAEVSKIESSLWFKDVMDLTTEEWQRQTMIYSKSKSLMSRPPYQYHIIKYYGERGGKSGPEAQKEFVESGIKLKNDLAKRYKSPSKC